MALANDQAVLALSEEQVDVLMYQFPLYTTGGPAGTRGIDLVGHSHQSGRIWVIEVKVMPKGGRGQTPLRGLYEGLIYAAIVEANHQAIAAELGSAQFLRTSATIRPGVIVAAPSNYWSKWKADGHTGDWWPMYAEVVGRISESLETPIEIIDLGDVWFSGVAGKPFYLTGEINPQNVRY